MQISESFRGAFSESRIDRGTGVIHNVKLLGRVSRNGRTYSDDAMADAVRLYDGAKVFFDHPTARELRERDGVRSVRDLAGRIRNPRKAGDAVRGDFEILNAPSIRETVLALASSRIGGFSHRAVGQVRDSVVEGLESVAALELVSDPATTANLFEGRTEPRDRRAELLEQATRTWFTASGTFAHPSPRRAEKEGTVLENGALLQTAIETWFT